MMRRSTPLVIALTTILHETIDGAVTVGSTIPNGDWKFCGGGTFAAPLPVTARPVRICLKDGFDPTKLYQLTYSVKDPYVLGVGTAAFRDVQFSGFRGSYDEVKTIHDLGFEDATARRKRAALWPPLTFTETYRDHCEAFTAIARCGD